MNIANRSKGDRAYILPIATRLVSRFGLDPALLDAIREQQGAPIERTHQLLEAVIGLLEAVDSKTQQSTQETTEFLVNRDNNLLTKKGKKKDEETT